MTVVAVELEVVVLGPLGNGCSVSVDSATAVISRGACVPVINRRCSGSVPDVQLAVAGCASSVSGA